MCRLPNLSWFLCLALYPLLFSAANPARAQQSAVANQGAAKQGIPDQELFPTTNKPVPAPEAFPSIPASPLSKTPLSSPPYVFRLKHLEPSEMSSQDASVVASFRPKIEEKAAQFDFDLTSPGWRYRQISCPAFPDYIFLGYSGSSSSSGSSSFVAALNRNGSKVLIVPSFAHGARLSTAWSNPSSYVIFNRILLEERGRTSLSRAPNWLVISMCYAEFTGNHVQALTQLPLPDASLDLTRLEGTLPQLNLGSDQTAVVTFSDASKPARTTDWTLSFDGDGQLTAVSQDSTRQPSNIALKP